MSKMVTRCPQCQTSFRVTDEHLKAANGAVRCGSCLNVFQAKDHWVPDVPLTATPSAPEKPAARFTTPIPTPSFLQAADKLAAKSQIPVNPTAASPASAANQTSTAEQFQLKKPTTDTTPKGKFQFDQSAIDSGSASSFLAKQDERIPETVLTKAHARSVVEPDIRDVISNDSAPESASDLEGDPTESGLPDFGTEEDDYGSLFDDSDVANAESEDFESLLSGDFNDLDDFDMLPAAAPAAKEKDPEEEDSWAKELLDELEDDSTSAVLTTSDTQNENGLSLDYTNPTDVDAARRDLGLDEPLAFDMSKFVPISAQSPGLSGGSSDPEDKPEIPAASSALTGQARQPSNSRENLIAHIGPAPVEIHPVDPGTPAVWKTALTEIGICAVLVLSLIGQHVFFRFDHLAKNESTRPMVAFVCGILGCSLPPSDIWRNIRVSNLVVRKHDSVENALVVDAIIFNHASYELTFPKLELYFNDLEQLPVASRRFEPKEYLAGELAGKTVMPPGRPIHIAFEIVNPGDKAVNWRLDVTPFQ